MKYGTLSFLALILLCAPARLLSQSGNCDVSQGDDLFYNKVKPLITNNRLVSCNQCHYADFTYWEKETPSLTMATMVFYGEADLFQPDSSKMLERIIKGKPLAVSAADKATIQNEHDSFYEWIAWSAGCPPPPLDASDNPGGSLRSNFGLGSSGSPMIRTLEDTLLAQAYVEIVGFPGTNQITAGSCGACHVPKSESGGDSAVAYLGAIPPDPDFVNYLTTALVFMDTINIRSLTDSPYVNIQAPEESWFLKKGLGKIAANSLPGEIIHKCGAKFGGPNIDPGSAQDIPFQARLEFLRLYVGTRATKVSTPALQPGGGTFTGGVLITLTSATLGSDIYYTTDGSEPTASSTLYQGPFILNASGTLKVKGIKTNLLDSDLGQASFVINPDVSAPAVVSVTSVGPINQVKVVFSELVSKETAEDISNYSLDGGRIITSARLQEDGKTVILFTTALAELGNYNLSLSGVTDVANPPNSLAQTSSAFTHTAVLFYDNFDDGNDNGWTRTEGQWRVQNGSYTHNNAGGISLSWAEGQTFTDFDLYVDVTAVSGDIQFVIFRVRNLNNFYMFDLSSFTLYRRQYGNYTPLLAGIPSGTSPFKIKISAVGKSIKIWSDQTLVLEFEDQVFESGSVGVGATSGNVGAFDEVKVTWPASENPVGRVFPAKFHGADSKVAVQVTSGRLNIHCYHGCSDLQDVYLFDLQGKKLVTNFHKNGNVIKSENKLRNGLYFVKLIRGERQTIHSVVVH